MYEFLIIFFVCILILACWDTFESYAADFACWSFDGHSKLYSIAQWLEDRAFDIGERIEQVRDAIAFDGSILRAAAPLLCGVTIFSLICSILLNAL